MPGRSGRRQVYPWEKWFNRKTTLTLKREDYTATPVSMVVMLRTKAKEFGKKITVKVHHDTSISMKVVGERDD